MSDDRRSLEEQTETGPKSRWYVLDAVLLGFLFLWGTFANAMPLLFYLGGLRNEMALPFGATMCLTWLLPLAAIAYLAVVIRASWCWSRYITNRRKLAVLQLAAIVLPLVYGSLWLTKIGPPGYKAHLWGFGKFAASHVDDTAIRTWLGTLDRERWNGVQIDVAGERGFDGEPVTLAFPPCIENLRPRYAVFWKVEGHDLAVNLAWGSGFVGTWGLVIGPDGVGAPPFALSGGADYAYSVKPGVRVWAEIE